MPDYPRVCHFLEGGLARCCASCLRMWILFARVSMLSVGSWVCCCCVPLVVNVVFLILVVEICAQCGDGSFRKRVEIVADP